MKRIIFRNPFVTKDDKRAALNYLKISDDLLTTADRYFQNDISRTGYTDQGYELVLQSTNMLNVAAKRLGFRNVIDMKEYRIRHGHF